MGFIDSIFGKNDEEKVKKEKGNTQKIEMNKNRIIEKKNQKKEIEKDSLLTISFFSEFHFKKNGDNTSFDEGQLIQLEHEKWVVKEKELLIYKIKDYKNYLTLCEPDRHLDYSFSGWDSSKENNKKVFECSKELIEILENLSVEKFELNNKFLLEDLTFEGQISIEKKDREIGQFRYQDKEKLSDEEKEMFFIIPSQNVFLQSGLKLINIDNSNKNNPFINFVSSVSFKYGSDYKTTLTSLKKLKVIIEKGGGYFRKIETSKKEINDGLIEYKTNKKELILDNNLYFDILKNNQSKIIEIDREYVQKFIKLNNYLKEKSSNLSVILDKIIYNLENEPKEFIVEREEEINFFKGLVYSYNLMVNQSIVMVTSLVEDDMIVFYETYEVFDKMNVFNTNWENEVNDKLSEINESLQDLNFSIRGLMNQMRDMERNIVNGLQSINTSIGSLENSVNKQLSETNSRLKYDNLTSYYSKSTLKGSWDWFDGP